MRVMLLGSTGMTGSRVLGGLLSADAVDEVVLPVRRGDHPDHEKCRAEVLDFQHLDDYQSLFNVDVIICCLGTTIRKAGSKAVFRRVDHDYPLQAAKLGRAEGARAYILMSAVGASARAPVFYSRVKGEVEKAIEALEYPHLSIYQPGLLMGHRSEHRPGERLGMRVMPWLNPLLAGGLSRYRGIEAAQVARAMVNEVIGLSGRLDSDGPSVRRLRHREILRQASGESV